MISNTKDTILTFKLISSISVNSLITPTINIMIKEIRESSSVHQRILKSLSWKCLSHPIIIEKFIKIVVEKLRNISWFISTPLISILFSNCSRNILLPNHIPIN